MTDKAIIDIPLDTSAFEAFRVKFELLRAKTDETPKAWDAIGKTAETTAQTFDQLAASLGKMQAALDGIADKTDEATADQEAASNRWAQIASSAKLFGANIKESGLSLAKWTGLTGLFAGIMSAGGLYGISRMAANVSGRRTAAMSYGMGYGEMESYRTNFARLGNAGGLLAGFNTALNSVQDRWPLYALMGPGADRRLAGKSPGAALAEALPDIKRFVDNTDPHNMAGALHASGLDRIGVDVGTALTFRRMSPQEIAQMASDFADDQGPMGLSREMAQKWQEFDIALAMAGAEIENRFAVNLVNLAPGLTRLTDGLSGLVDHALQKGGPVEGWLKRADKGLVGFAALVGSKDFLATTGRIVRGVADATSVIDQITLKPLLKPLGIAADVGVWGLKVADYASSGDMTEDAKSWARRKMGLNTPEDDARDAKRWARYRARNAAENAAERRWGGDSLDRSGISPRVGLETPDQSAWGANTGGAPLNYDEIRGRANQDRGQWGAPGQNLVQITDPQGKGVTVNAVAAPHFQAFLEELEGRGYRVNSLGGYNYRSKVGGGGLSQHAYGNAIDVNPYANPFGGGRSDMPEDVSEMAARHGLSWGGDWHGTKDPMHFEYTGIEPRLADRHPHMHGQTNTVHVDDETGDADVKKSSRSVGPMTSYDAGNFGRFGH